MNDRDEQEIRQAVRQRYGQVANQDEPGCGCKPSGCCPEEDLISLESLQELASTQWGYSEAELDSVPTGADLGLGCGNPQAIARLKAGETVLDLGSGAGFDCFLAAHQVGPDGRVIGVDMTPEMVSRARANAAKGDYAMVEFRLGEIEHLPVETGSVDVIISNCVVNLSPDKPQVFREAFRVLKPGGRLAISDVVATVELPDELKADLNLYSACVSGAETIASLQSMLHEAGFVDIALRPKDESREFIRQWIPGSSVEAYVVSASIEAKKPQI